MGKNKRRRKEGSNQQHHVAGTTVVATSEEGIVYHLEDVTASATSDAHQLPEWTIDYVQGINTAVSALVSTRVPSFNDISECMVKGTLDRLQSKKNKSKRKKDNNNESSASAATAVTPTSIQLRMWPAMLQSFQSQESNKADTSTNTHNNIYGISPTGTGKTLSYALPIVTHCVWRQLCQTRDNNGHPHKGVFVHSMVLAPTRELAIQISKEFKVVAKTANKILSKCCEETHQLSVQALAIYGGVDIESQISSFSLDQSEYNSESVESKSLIVASTPGRLQDLLNKDNNMTIISAFENLQSIVFDEADRIAMNPEMTSQVDDILDLLNKCRKQKNNIVSCLVSATLPEKAKEICDRWVPRSRYIVKIDSVKITKEEPSVKQADDAASDKDEDISSKMEATKTHKRHIDIDLASIPSHLVQTCKLKMHTLR